MLKITHFTQRHICPCILHKFWSTNHPQDKRKVLVLRAHEKFDQFLADTGLKNPAPKVIDRVRLLWEDTKRQDAMHKEAFGVCSHHPEMSGINVHDHHTIIENQVHSLSSAALKTKLGIDVPDGIVQAKSAEEAMSTILNDPDVRFHHADDKIPGAHIRQLHLHVVDGLNNKEVELERHIFDRLAFAYKVGCISRLIPIGSVVLHSGLDALPKPAPIVEPEPEDDGWPLE